MHDDDGRSFALFLELYGGLPRAGPGSDEATREALDRLPAGRRRRVLDLGCGPGAQTLVLARSLPDAQILALDLLPLMAAECRRRAVAAGVGVRVRAVVADMGAPPAAAAAHDLIWSEGAIYNVGVERGLRSWRPLLAPGGCVAFTEAVWLRPHPPREIFEWWTAEYPAITDGDGVARAAAAAGYELLASFTLPASAWWDGYYRHLEAKIPAFLADHAGDEAAAAVARAAETELEMHRRWGEWYSYGFFVVRPAS